MVTDRLSRMAAEGFARRGEHMGVRLVARTLASIGVGNIGAEPFRLAKPLDMRFIARDPYVDARFVAELGAELMRLYDVLRQADILSVNCPLNEETRRRIAGAGLDMLRDEPPTPDDPILRLDNVIPTPHALCWTDQCFAGNGAADVRAVLDVKAGREPRGLVNEDVLATDAWQRRLRAFAVMKP